MHQFGDVEHELKVVGAEADSLVRCSGESDQEVLGRSLAVVRDDKGERLVDELVRDAERLLVPYLGKHAPLIVV